MNENKNYSVIPKVAVDKIYEVLDDQSNEYYDTCIELDVGDMEEYDEERLVELAEDVIKAAEETEIAKDYDVKLLVEAVFRGKRLIT